MLLYLSSLGVGGTPDALRELVAGSSRAALVFNARDGYGSDRLKFQRAEFEELTSLGFQCDELDLRSYFDDFEGLRARLGSYDLVWVVGGNTFVLARAMTQARFGDAIREQLCDERIVYGGYSAGICVIGPDLDGCHLMDDPDVRPEGYAIDSPADTLGWVPWRIVPHWRSDHEEAPLADLAVEHLLESGLPFQTLRDGQVFIVNGEQRRIA